MVPTTISRPSTPSSTTRDPRKEGSNALPAQKHLPNPSPPPASLIYSVAVSPEQTLMLFSVISSNKHALSLASPYCILSMGL